MLDYNKLCIKPPLTSAHLSSLLLLTRELYLDRMSIGPLGERNIAMGIAANPIGALQVLTGFHLGQVSYGRLNQGLSGSLFSFPYFMSIICLALSLPARYFFFSMMHDSLTIGSDLFDVIENVSADLNASNIFRF